MKYIKQFTIIITVSCIGELIKYFVHLPIPGSIYGLVLMLLVLATGIIKVEDVSDTADFLITFMPLMFIPATVGIIDMYADIKSILLPLAIITLISTLIVFFVTGKITDLIIGRKENDNEGIDA